MKTQLHPLWVVCMCRSLNEMMGSADMYLGPFSSLSLSTVLSICIFSPNAICNAVRETHYQKSKHIRSDITINHITTTTTVNRRERTGRLLLLYAINVKCYALLFIEHGCRNSLCNDNGFAHSREMSLVKKPLSLYQCTFLFPFSCFTHSPYWVCISIFRSRCSYVCAICTTLQNNVTVTVYNSQHFIPWWWDENDRH